MTRAKPASTRSAANGTAGDDSLQMDDTYLARDTETINFTLVLAGEGDDPGGGRQRSVLLLCDRFTTEFYGGPGSDTMTVREIEAATLLDGGDGDGYEVDFGMLAAGLTINDGGKVGFDVLTVKAPGAVRSEVGRPGVWLITSAQVTDGSESMSYSGSIEQLGFAAGRRRDDPSQSVTQHGDQHQRRWACPRRWSCGGRGRQACNDFARPG